MPEFLDLKEKLEKLEERVTSHDNRFTEHETIMDNTNNNMQMIQTTVSDHGEKIESCISSFTVLLVMKTKEEIESMKEKMEKMMAESKEMKEASEKMKKEIARMEEEIEKLKKCIGDIDSINRRLEKLMNEKTSVIKSEVAIKPETDHVVRENTIRETKTIIDTSALDDLRNSLLDTLASKDDLNYLTTRVESLETLSSNLSQQQDKANKEIEKINERLKALESQMLDKVSCEQYDELVALINALRAAINNKADPGTAGTTGPAAPVLMAAPVGPTVSSKDLNLIREVASKITDLETRVNALSK